MSAPADAAHGEGVGVHLYAATASMQDRVFASADGELLIVPQEGRLEVATELGVLELEPLQVGLIPRGVRFRVALPDGRARGYVSCENYGALFRLPDLGPIGANGLASPRDFETPVAAFEDRDAATESVLKFQGRLWTTELDHSPLDVVAWHGNLAPCRYDLRRFNTINTVSFDHPDPSIFTVLTSPSPVAGTANCDFVIFPPRWMVADDTFRPPWFHRNVMSEFMGLITGACGNGRTRRSSTATRSASPTASSVNASTAWAARWPISASSTATPSRSWIGTPTATSNASGASPWPAPCS